VLRRLEKEGYVHSPTVAVLRGAPADVFELTPKGKEQLTKAGL
jgi:DNA-binding PadR family transcriptional regulator